MRGRHICPYSQGPKGPLRNFPPSVRWVCPDWLLEENIEGGGWWVSQQYWLGSEPHNHLPQWRRLVVRGPRRAGGVTVGDPCSSASGTLPSRNGCSRYSEAG